MTEICDGNTVARVDCLIKEAKLFSKLCQTDLDRAEEVISCGMQLVQKAACPREVVQPKCDELSRIRNLINDRLNKRREILMKSRELMDRVEKVRNGKWGGICGGHLNWHRLDGSEAKVATAAKCFTQYN